MVEPGSFFRRAFDALASLTVPAPCRICREPISDGSFAPVCAICLDRMPRLPGPICCGCGRYFPSGVAADTPAPKCQLCRREVYSFDRARSFAIYENETVRAITVLKHQPILPLGHWFARQLAEMVLAWDEGIFPDVVVPVPLHASRQKERGYNQADLIARPLAQRLGLPYLPHALIRTRPRPNKLRLTRKERWRVVRGAYSTREGRQVDNLRVLLVDDVFTTGATLDACSRALRKAGAVRVAAITAARVVPEWVVIRGPGLTGGVNPPGPRKASKFL